MEQYTLKNRKLITIYSLCKKLLIYCALFSTVYLQAQSYSSVFTGPQNMDQGLQLGLNNITGYVYSILKFLSLIGLGTAYYFVTHNGIAKAIMATIAAVLLWFAPVVANIAQNLGSAAAQQSALNSGG
jgi:hypothetical protein